MRRALVPIAVILAVPLVLWAGCAVYGVDLLVAGDGGGADAGAGADGDAGPQGCAHAGPPARPDGDDPGGVDTEVVAAITLVDFGLDAGASRSFDLDDTCTCPGPESCKPLAGSKHCDDDAGRDNAGGPLLAKFAALSSTFDPNGVNARIGEGQNTLIVRVRRWNGLPNDTSVELDVFVSSGTAPQDDAGHGPPPKHDGTDVWAVDSASLVGGIAPPYVPTFVDENAYVSGGMVVATLDFPLSLGGGYAAAFISLSGARVVGVLEDRATGHAIKDARVVGRWGSRNLLTSLQVAGDPFNKGQYLCGSDLTYQTLKSEICKAADLATNAQNDNSGAACDAMSLVLSFQSEPATLGPATTATGVDGGAVAPCGASYTDQCGL